MLHSLAFGTLKLFVADPMKEAVTKAQMDMTLDVMAHSLIYWAQELVGRGLMGEGGRIFAMTSSGGARVLPITGRCPRPRPRWSRTSASSPPSWPRSGSPRTRSGPASPRPPPPEDPELRDVLPPAAGGIPIGRLTTTEDVARAIVVLRTPTRTG